MEGRGIREGVLEGAIHGWDLEGGSVFVWGAGLVVRGGMETFQRERGFNRPSGQRETASLDGPQVPSSPREQMWG